MGRVVEDGDFAAFQDRVLALPAVFDGLSVRWETLRGDVLAFDWHGPFQKNGEIVPQKVDAHIDSPYCVAEFPATSMDIAYGDVVMRLAFGEGAGDVTSDG